MIKLYYNKNDKNALKAKERLRALVIAHQCIEIPGKKTFLEDGRQSFNSPEDINRHIDDLEAFKEEWDRFQSDACYCDSDGNTV